MCSRRTAAEGRTVVTPRSLAFVVATILLSGCATPARQAAPAVPQATAQLPNDLKWTRDAAEYYALVFQTYRTATEKVEREAAKLERGTWAVSLDADETVISNLQYQVNQGGAGFTRDTWAAWVRERRAVPLPGAREFLERVRALGGRVVIVTNRYVSQCPDTEAVFKTYDLPYDVMLCRPDDGPSDKNPRFRAIATGEAFGLTSPIEVVAFVGDNIHDFPELSQEARSAGAEAFAEFGERFFVLPNPMYGSWQ